MKQLPKPKISDEQVKAIIEQYNLAAKDRRRKIALYIFKPALTPILILLIILNIFLISRLFSVNKPDNETSITPDNAQSVNEESLNTDYSENAKLFNSSIVLFTNEVDKYLTQSPNTVVSSKLKAQGKKLLQIDSLSPQQKKFLIKSLQKLD